MNVDETQRKEPLQAWGRFAFGGASKARLASLSPLETPHFASSIPGLELALWFPRAISVRQLEGVRSAVVPSK